VTDADAACIPRPKTAAVVASTAKHFKRTADFRIDDLPCLVAARRAFSARLR
jgi:hypothetical protein